MIFRKAQDDAVCQFFRTVVYLPEIRVRLLPQIRRIIC